MAFLQNETIFVHDNQVQIDVIFCNTVGSLETYEVCISGKIGETLYNKFTLFHFWFYFDRGRVHFSLEHKLSSFSSKLHLYPNMPMPSIALMFALSIYDECYSSEFIKIDNDFEAKLLQSANGIDLDLIPYVEILRSFAVFGRWEYWRKFKFVVQPDYVDDTIAALQYAYYSNLKANFKLFYKLQMEENLKSFEQNE